MDSNVPITDTFEEEDVPYYITEGQSLLHMTFGRLRVDY